MVAISYGSLVGIALALLSTTSRIIAKAADVPKYAPIPAGGIGPDIPPEGYRVEAFGGGAYMLTESQYQVLFVVSTKGVIVVDAPPTIGHKILYGIGNTTNIPVTHLIYSHAHVDHIGAAYLFGPKVKIIAHSLTRDILKVTPDPNRPLPNVVFDDKHTLQVGNQTLKLEYKGLAHQPGNIFIYAPKQKVLMLVDIVYPGWVPFAYLGQAQFVPGYIKAYDQALEYDFDHFVGGHLTRSGTRSDVLIGQEYVSDLKSNCIKAIQLSALPPNATNPVSAGGIIGPVQAANPGNPWSIFRAYLDTLAEYCANLTNEKWLGVLGAADVYGVTNAYIMVESLRLDFDVLGPFGVMN
jgi:glyoxylase-like metal-dependent hydrolase (beta-lactamase superfamily II)